MNPQSSMGLASELLTDMVMEQAIKDKTDMVQKQMEAQDPGISPYTIEAADKQGGDDEEKKSDQDSGFSDDDGDAAAIMRSMAEQRLAMMKEEY